MDEKKRPPVWLWIIVVVVLLGCGSVMVNSYFRIQDAKARVRVSNDMKMVGLAYHQFQETNHRPPRSFEELAKFAQEKGDSLPDGAASVTVFWGAGVGNLNKDGPAGEVVLGHAPAPNGKDVVVLYVDGSVKQEDAATFASEEGHPAANAIKDIPDVGQASGLPIQDGRPGGLPHIKTQNEGSAMFVRILTAGMILLFVVGCAKKTAKKPSQDDSASTKPATPAPNDRDKKNDKKGEKADEPNWLTDPRFKKDPPSTATPLPPAGGATGKESWGIAPPQGGWEGPNPGVGPIQPAGPGGPGGLPAPGPGPAAPPSPGMGVLQPQPMLPAPGGTPTTPKYSTVTEADMKEVWVFVENRSGATGKMPSQLDIYQALVAAGYSSAPLVKDGSIYLTGATTRESIWAFETKALISGGLVCSQNGVETLTAAELKARLSK